jgi:hypothetical protein
LTLINTHSKGVFHDTSGLVEADSIRHFPGPSRHRYQEEILQVLGFHKIVVHAPVRRTTADGNSSDSPFERGRRPLGLRGLSPGRKEDNPLAAEA